MSVRAYKTKAIRPISSTRSAGRIISPTKELRNLKVGHFLIVDDSKSRRHMVNCAHRLNLAVTTRKRQKGGGYEIHRVAKPAPLEIYDYPVLGT